MNIGDFEFSAAVSAAAVLLALLLGVVPGAGLLYFLSLAALTQAGYFALAAFKKSGLSKNNSEYLFILAVAVCFLAVVVSTGSLFGLAPLAFIPALFCAPAAASLLRTVLFSG